MAIPGLLVQHAHAQAALQGIERIYQLKTDHHGTPSPLAPTQIGGHFKLEDVTFAYGDNPPALSIGQWEVKPAERIAILGPIGAGKSTLLRILSGMYTPQAGRVLLDQLDLSHINRQVVCQHIGYLQQDHRLFQGSLRENLLIGMPDPGDEAILHAMKQTGMDRFVASHPRGLARQIAEGGKGLSGGQKQLVAFTRLVLCDPTVWLLDEPTASMDDDQERRCLSVLAQRAQQGKTLVIVTHKPSLLPLVNRMVVMSGNGIVLDGARDQVLNELQARHAKATGQVPQTVTEVAAL
jgi:ATP-binding cassette subfamily C protein LapB